MRASKQGVGGALRLIFRTGGLRALERAVPLYLGIAIAASVLFAPQGLEARDVARMAAASLPFRVALWGAWLVASVPLAGTILRDRRVDFLRALPIARALPSLAVGTCLAALQLPWAVLWLRGAGTAGGVAAVVLGFGLSVLFAGGAPALFERALLAACAAALLFDAPPWAVFSLAPLLMVAAHRAWLRAPERPRATASWARGPAPVALSIAHHLRLVRVERFAALRGLGLAILGGAAAALAAQNTAMAGNTGRLDERLVPFMLAVMGPALVLAASGLAAPIREADASLDVVLRSAGVSARWRRAVLLAVAAAWGAAYGAASFATARAFLGASLPVTALGACAVLGASLAALALCVRGSAGRVIVLLGALGAATPILAAWIGEAAVLVLGALALASLWWGGRSSSPERPAVTGDDLLWVEGVCKHFGGRDVLRGADLRLAPGTVAVLRGPNGSGKSTLLRIIAGVLEKDAGVVAVAGRSHDGDRRRALREVGYAPDAGELPDHLSVRELLTLVAALRSVAPAAEAEEVRLGIAELAHERLSSLSLGQRRRVGLMSALIGRPRLLLLDEPTNGLDRAGLSLLDAILGEQRARGGAALVASHEPAFAKRIADALFDLVDGVVQPGAP